MSTVKKEGVLVVADNRQARRDFFILDKIEAGLELKGSEVKSVREGQVNLKEGYVLEDRGEMFLKGVHIKPYEYASQSLNPDRTRKLLLHKKEIRRWSMETQQKGLTMVPLRVYFKNGRAKLEIGLAKGKKRFDKRETIKQRESNIEIDRATKGRQKR